MHRPIACLVVALLLTSTAGASVDPSAAGSSAPRQFIIGMAGRLRSSTDRRYPRQWYRADSPVDAYVDVEEVEDPTWLSEEVQAYGRRVADCAELGPTWCRRELRPQDGGTVLFIAAGVNAEIVWVADGNRAVRLGWRRVVETPTGTLTLDTPPEAFAALLLSDMPTRLRGDALAGSDDDRWRDRELDRLMHYVDRALTSLPATASADERRAVERFAARNLARVARLAGLDLMLSHQVARRDGAALPLALAERLAAVRDWRAAMHPLMTDAREWCAASPVQ